MTAHGVPDHDRATGHVHRQGRRRQPDRHRRRVVRLLPLRRRPPRSSSARCSSRPIDPPTGTLLAFGTYALGFVARPLGGLVFGHFGDQVGRKKLLVVSPADDGRRRPSRSACCRRTPRSASRRRSCSWSAAASRASRVGGEWGGAVLIVSEHGDAGAARLLGLVAAGRRAAGQPARHRRAVRARRGADATRRSWPGAGGSRSCCPRVLVLIGLWVRLADRGVAGLQARRRPSARGKRRRRQHDADPRGAPAATRARCFIAMGCPDGREHLLLHLHDRHHHLRRRRSSTWTSPFVLNARADRRGRPLRHDPAVGRAVRPGRPPPALPRSAPSASGCGRSSSSRCSTPRASR